MIDQTAKHRRALSQHMEAVERRAGPIMAGTRVRLAPFTVLHSTLGTERQAWRESVPARCGVVMERTIGRLHSCAECWVVEPRPGPVVGADGRLMVRLDATGEHPERIVFAGRDEMDVI